MSSSSETMEKSTGDSHIPKSSYPRVPPQWGANYTRTTHLDTYDYIDPLKNADCTGKAVLVTGGAKGIGKAIALSYAKAGAAYIAITSRSTPESEVTDIEEAAVSVGRPRPNVLALQVDVSDPASVNRAATALEAAWGKLDILISNAGFLYLKCPLLAIRLAKYDKILDGDEWEWWQSFEVNLKGSYLVAKAFLPLMLKGGDKTYISIASTGAMHFHTGGSSYQISKHALLRLCEYLMAEYGEQGLLCYSVHPGGVATDLAKRLPEQTQVWLKCTPSLAGDTLAFLTSRRQDWLAGRYLSVMWDMEEMFTEKKDEIIDKDLLKMRMNF
ncbi:NAD(P)-binding protein [Xylariomycetidae sp. FL2044]|nr:NAD(P)-binding protein [Xylariomycetidae sp. FL2044]